MPSFIIKTEKKDEIYFEVPLSFDLDQIIEAFSIFLKASGYKLNGYLDIYPYDDGK